MEITNCYTIEIRNFVDDNAMLSTKTSLVSDDNIVITNNTTWYFKRGFFFWFGNSL